MIFGCCGTTVQTSRMQACLQTVTSKKYSVVKITGNGRREARKRGVSFLTRCKRGQTCASRDYQGKVAGKRTTNEGYFRPAKIREQRSEQLILSALCLLHPFGRQKGETETTAYNLATKIKGKNYRRI